MSNYKDKRIEQTPAQRNPYEARPQDFQVGGIDVAGHGQHGQNEGEYKKLLQQADHGKSPFGKKA
jgi:hypothetical protein